MTASPAKVAHQSALYEQDYYLWLKATIHQLKEKQFSALDLPNLIEEIEDMGRSERRSLESNLVVVLLHLLKYQCQPEKRSNSWKASIREHRRRLRKALEESPSLKRYFVEIFEECYQDARKLASDETGLSLDMFPMQPPFELEDSLESEFLPI